MKKTKRKSILAVVLVGLLAISLISCNKQEIKDSDMLNIIGENKEDIKEIRLTTGKLVPDEYKKIADEDQIDKIIDEMQTIKFIEEVDKKESEKEIKPEDINWAMILFTKSGNGITLTSLKNSDNIAIKKGVKEVFYKTDYNDEILDKIIDIAKIRRDQLN